MKKIKYTPTQYQQFWILCASDETSVRDGKIEVCNRKPLYWVSKY